MKQITRDNVPFYHFDDFPTNGHIQHAVFTRRGGISEAPYDSLNLSASVPDTKENVYANRSRAYSTHGRTSDRLVHAHLIHGADVARVSKRDYGRHVGPVDGLITNDPGCGLTMNFADCAAIMLYDPVNKAIGLGHAGWQGVVKDLPGAMVRAMQRAFDTEPGLLVAGIGPCIGPCCYEVGEAVISAVRSAFEAPDLLLVPSPNDDKHSKDGQRPHFDLPEANRRRLASSGVIHIEASGMCTACHTDLFYSHRAEQNRTGRFGTLLLLE